MGFNHVSAHHFIQELDIFAPIKVVIKDWLTIISASRHMINFTNCTEAQRMSHDLYIMQ